MFAPGGTAGGNGAPSAADRQGVPVTFAGGHSWRRRAMKQNFRENWQNRGTRSREIKMTTRTKKAAGLLAIAAMAMLVLTACINVTYKLTVNSDATVSGTLQAAISKQVLGSLGVTSKEQLNQSLTSGELDTGVNSDVAKTCKVGEDDTNYTITCTIDHVQASDLNEAWSLSKADGNLTLHVVSDTQATAGDQSATPGMSIGDLSFTATFPGPISSITGNGGTKVDENTVTVAGSLSDSFDVTVVAASEPSSSAKLVWIIVIAGLVVLAILAVIALAVRRGKKDEAIVDVIEDAPPTADSSDPSI